MSKEDLNAERKHAGPQLVYLRTLIYRVRSYEADAGKITGNVLRAFEKPPCYIVEFANIFVRMESSSQLRFLRRRLTLPPRYGGFPQI